MTDHSTNAPCYESSHGSCNQSSHDTSIERRDESCNQSSTSRSTNRPTYLQPPTSNQTLEPLPSQKNGSTQVRYSREGRMMA